MLLQQADSAWLYIEFIVCFGPSRISCLVKGWNCSLGDLNDHQSLRFHGWCGWQTSCWESLLGQSSPHLPKRLRFKAWDVVRCPFLRFFDFIPWENSGKHLVWTRTRSYWQSTWIHSFLSSCLLMCFGNSIWGQKDHRPGCDGSDFFPSSKFNHFGSCNPMGTFQAFKTCLSSKVTSMIWRYE